MIHIEKSVFYLFEENCYTVWDDTLECVLIDPGCERDEERKALARLIAENGLTPRMILLTHAHLDHIFGVRECADTYGIPVMMDPREMQSIEMFNLAFSKLGIHTPQSFEFTAISDGQQLRFGNTSLRALSTPGHSMGGTCWWFEDDGVIFTGDTLFKGCIGRTDNDCASLEMLLDSVRGTLMQLDSDIRVYPGHGPDTTIGYERATNPFIYENNGFGNE